MYAVAIDWERCPDGVEVIYKGPPGSTGESDPRYDAMGTGYWFYYRSDRREKFTRTLADLSEPLVTQFVNASTVEALTAFFNRFGIPQAQPALGVDLAGTVNAQLAVKDLFKSYTEGNVANLLETFDNIAKRRLGKITPRLSWSGANPSLTLVPDSLIAFMTLEATMIMAGGARMMKCHRCGSLFLSGSNTGRRSTAYYCSNRCRVGAQRESHRHLVAEEVPPQTTARRDPRVTPTNTAPPSTAKVDRIKPLKIKEKTAKIKAPIH